VLPTKSQIDDIQILRVFAVILVVIQHVPINLVDWHAPWAQLIILHFGGDLGVDLFLVISGFVIGRSFVATLADESSSYRFVTKTIAFWLRRVWRLLPSAWLWLILPILGSVYLNESGAFRSTYGNLHAALFAILNLANVHSHIYSMPSLFELASKGHILFVHWSLSLEEQFYLLLPFIVFFSGRRLSLILAILITIQLMSDKFTFDYVMFRTDGLFLGVLLSRTTGTAWTNPLADFFNACLRKLKYFSLICRCRQNSDAINPLPCCSNTNACQSALLRLFIINTSIKILP